MNDLFEMSFAPESISEIARFYGFAVLLREEVQAAMHQGGALLAQAAQDKTWEVFANPSGALASTIAPVEESIYEVRIGSDSPYARRRELGFSGMTDSLGRTYVNDPAKPYLAPALADNEQRVLQLIDAAVSVSLGRVAGG